VESKFLPCVTLNFACRHPVPDGSFIAERHRCDVIERRTLRDMAASLADDEHDFALIIELR